MLRPGPEEWRRQAALFGCASGDIRCAKPCRSQIAIGDGLFVCDIFRTSRRKTKVLEFRTASFINFL
jgi:hypothetical protein